MNNYGNSQDSTNNNYDQSYGQENGGEYSYSYTPRDTQRRRARAMIIRFIIFGAVSALLSVMVILPGVIFGALAIKNFLGDSDNNVSAVAVSGDSTVVDHGISTVDVTSKNLYYYYRYGITSTGVIVTSSEYTDELKFGDRIISVNGVDIYSSEDIEGAVSNCSVGDVMELTVERGGKQVTVSLTLSERIPDYVDFE